MSEFNTPPSGDRSFSSSQSSRRGSYSDTTPSPSGDPTRQPHFNPDTLSNKLAFLEASKSLAHAAKTLSVAAKAMSKAAASLALAGGYEQDDEYGSVTGRPRKRARFQDWTDPLDWQQNEYFLPPANVPHDTSGDSNERREIIPEHIGTIDETIPEEVAPGPASTTQTSNGETEAPQVSTPSSSAIVLEALAEPMSPEESNGEPDVATTNSSHDTADRKETHDDKYSEGSMIPSERAGISSTAPPKPMAEATSSFSFTFTYSAPTAASQKPSSTPSQRSLTRIILDRAFDQLPVVCALAKVGKKTICFYKLWGAAQIVGSMLRNNVPQSYDVIVPTADFFSLNQATNRFISAPSAILLWPANVTLANIKDISNFSEAHIVQIGQPLDENADIETMKVSLVLTLKELKEMDPSSRKQIAIRYRMDDMNTAYNKQGEGSELHSTRAWMRACLAEDTSARKLYKAWMAFQRKLHPRWTTQQLTSQANQYAEEYLLRGSSETNEDLVGGPIEVENQYSIWFP